MARGSIQKLGDQKYRVRVFIGWGLPVEGRTYRGKPVTGKVQKYRTTVVHGTHRQAQTVLTKMLGAKDGGSLFAPSKMTLEDFFDGEWLPKAVRPSLAATTALSYETYFDAYFRKTLGPMPLSKIGPLDVQGVYTAMIERRLAPRTVRYAHSILRAAFKQAIAWRMIPVNPAEGAKLPEKSKSKTPRLSHDQVAAVLDAAKDDPLFPVFHVAAFTGARPSEYLGLKWSDVDLDARTAAIARSLHFFPHDGWKFCPTKTEDSARTIALPAATIAVLRDWKKRQSEARPRANERHPLWIWWVRAARAKTKPATVSALADALGIEQSRLSKILTRRHRPTPELAATIVDFAGGAVKYRELFEVTPEELEGGIAPRWGRRKGAKK